MKKYVCLQCGCVFEHNKGCKTRTPKYCCKKCYSESMKMNKTCKICGKIIENKHSVSMKNRIYCSRECHGMSRRNKKLSDEWREALSEGRKKSEKCKGKNLYNWKGGKETESERLRLHAHKRKSLQKMTIDKDFLKRLLSAQKNKCFYCNADLTEYKAIEHLTPLSRGGDNEPYNLMYSCKSCNSKKRSKTMEEYAISIGKPYLVDKFDYIFSTAI